MSIKSAYNVRSGFTLLEVILVIALLAVIFAIGTPIYRGLQVRNDLDIAATAFAQSARRAEVLARGVDADSEWGVRVEQGVGIILFRGSSYAERNAAYDEVFGFPSSLFASGTLEYVFSKVTGTPQSTGTFTLTSNAHEVRTISINEKGVVTY